MAGLLFKQFGNVTVLTEIAQKNVGPTPKPDTVLKAPPAKKDVPSQPAKVKKDAEVSNGHAVKATTTLQLPMPWTEVILVTDRLNASTKFCEPGKKQVAGKMLRSRGAKIDIIKLGNICIQLERDATELYRIQVNVGGVKTPLIDSAYRKWIVDTARNAVNATETMQMKQEAFEDLTWLRSLLIKIKANGVPVKLEDHLEGGEKTTKDPQVKKQKTK